MRALSPIYSALPGPAGVDAKQAWVISGWGVLDPLLRYNLAKKADNKELVHLHDTFWLNERSPTAVRRKRKNRAVARSNARVLRRRRPLDARLLR